VLFCDLVGFTARSDEADPEDVGAHPLVAEAGSLLRYALPKSG
jgi:hypothetical protein